MLTLSVSGQYLHELPSMSQGLSEPIVSLFRLFLLEHHHLSFHQRVKFWISILISLIILIPLIFHTEIRALPYRRLLPHRTSSRELSTKRVSGMPTVHHGHLIQDGGGEQPLVIDPIVQPITMEHRWSSRILLHRSCTSEVSLDELLRLQDHGKKSGQIFLMAHEVGSMQIHSMDRVVQHFSPQQTSQELRTISRNSPQPILWITLRYMMMVQMLVSERILL